MANYTETETREKVRIDVESIPFDGMLKTKMTTTKRLGDVVNALLKPNLHDYEGCTILVNQFGQLTTSLFFVDKGDATDGKIKNIITSTTGKRAAGGIMDRISAMNAINSNKNYVLTKDTQEALEPFMYVRNPKKGVEWDKISFEMTENTYSGYRVYLKVIDVDIIKIIKAIYGKKDKETNSYLDYQINLIRPVSQFAGDLGNFLISIAQVNNKEVEELCKEINIIPVQGTIPMFRA
jgi:hypothetical protein